MVPNRPYTYGRLRDEMDAHEVPERTDTVVGENQEHAVGVRLLVVELEKALSGALRELTNEQNETNRTQNAHKVRQPW